MALFYGVARFCLALYFFILLINSPASAQASTAHMSQAGSHHNQAASLLQTLLRASSPSTVQLHGQLTSVQKHLTAAGTLLAKLGAMADSSSSNIMLRKAAKPISQYQALTSTYLIKAQQVLRGTNPDLDKVKDYAQQAQQVLAKVNLLHAQLRTTLSQSNTQ